MPHPLVQEEMEALEQARLLNEQLKTMMHEEAMANAPPSRNLDYLGDMYSNRAPGSGATTGSKGGKPRTFSSAPKTHQAKKMNPNNWTHTDARLNEIGRENHILADKMSKIIMRPAVGVPPPPPTNTPQHLKVASVAPSRINRRKQEDKIAAENMALHRRLQSVRPTMSNKKMAKDSQQQRQLSQQIRKVRPPPGSARPEWQD
mmetsp:Transcript_7051/g.24480  ORF Transcript_7051/g.24480 Transcript_7051/m.24480 type:complete len:203 (+) Transcript_7051:310-918(+)